MNHPPKGWPSVTARSNSMVSPIGKCNTSDSSMDEQVRAWQGERDPGLRHYNLLNVQRHRAYPDAPV